MIKRVEPIKRYIVLSKEDVGYKGEVMIVPMDIFLAPLPVSRKNL